MDGEVLAVDREIGKQTSTVRFSEVHYQSQVFRDPVTGVCPRQANVHASTKSDIKLESLILAQNERWRQA